MINKIILLIRGFIIKIKIIKILIINKNYYFVIKINQSKGHLKNITK